MQHHHMADRIAAKAEHMGKSRMVSLVDQFAADPASTEWCFAPRLRHLRCLT
jgi:hypothetical protein